MKLTRDELKALFPNATISCLAVNSQPVQEAVPEMLQASRVVADRASGRREVKELHEPFMQWLSLHEIPYLRARSDLPSTIKKGHPDFTLLWGANSGIGIARTCCIEMKWEGEKLRPDQAERFAELQKAGVPCAVCNSVQSAIAFAKAALEFEV